MKDVKRYLVSGSEFEVTQHPDGDYVEFDDHAAIVAALQEQVRALAAENSVLKNAVEQCKEFFKAWVLNRISPYNGAYLNALCAHAIEETPATNAALREIRRQVVDAAIDAMVRSGAQSFGDCVVAVNGIRAGENP